MRKIVVRTVENETISNEKVVAELYGIENRIITSIVLYRS